MKEVTYTKKVHFYQKKQFYVVLLGLFIIAIMVFSSLYYGLSDDTQKKVKYQGYNFIESSSGWMTYVNNEQKLLILSDPSMLNESFVEVNFNSMKGNSKIYVSYNPYDNANSALYDLDRSGLLTMQVYVACYEDNEQCSELPIKTCEDATNGVGVIVLKQANETRVSLNNNCLTIEGNDLLNIVDVFIVDQYGDRNE